MTADRPKPVAWWRPEGILPAAVRPGTEPWRWAAICARSLRVVIGIGLAVVATGLIGMGVGLTLHGLGVLRLNISQSDAEALAVGVAMAMIGCAILGLAVEGGFRSRSLHPDTVAWESTVTWIPALLITLWIVERLEGLATRLLPRFSDLLNLVPAYVNEVGKQGLAAGLVGLTLVWVALQFGAPRYRFIGENAPSLLYVCWMGMVTIGYWMAAA
ncbi:MAG: hypothetical protein OXS29_02415 [bacterium]|nr:hypothetical protein [bacterium]MDE0438360.1 hypothetical protein [bacterium]